VDEVCVLGVPDPYSGEIPVALVVLGDEAGERVEKDGEEVKRITISILKARSVTYSTGSSDEKCQSLQGVF